MTGTRLLEPARMWDHWIERERQKCGETYREADGGISTTSLGLRVRSKNKAGLNQQQKQMLGGHPALQRDIVKKPRPSNDFSFVTAP